MRYPEQTFSAKKTYGHIMLRKSYLWRFMLQFATLYACYKATFGLSQRPRYVSQARPLFREIIQWKLLCGGRRRDGGFFLHISGQKAFFLHECPMFAKINLERCEPIIR